jgi:hypothetical protein
MKKIRIGNDFVFSWAIERGGAPENLETVLEKHLYMIVFGTKTEIHNYTVSGNKIIVEFTPEMLNKIGIYTLIFYYVLPDESLSDNDRKCAVDIDAFQIVPRTAMADDVSEFAVTSDMAIAFKGDKGDPFRYEDFTPEQIEDLKRPAIEAAESVQIVENQISINEQGRVQAENERETAEATRVSNENNRVTAEQARVDAEIVREQQEQARQANTAIAIENANNAKGWTPLTVFEEYNGKQIKKLVGYIGGTGAEPTDNVGQYFTENGFTNNKDLAVNFKGSSVEAMIQTRDSYNQIPEPRNPNTLYFISNQA